MALACEPDLLIADEPTTALDVTVQAEVLAVLDRLVVETGAALLFITHDLALVQQVCDDLLVMRSGQIVDRGRAADVLTGRGHEYTRALLDAARLTAVPGAVDTDAGV
jgi:ABC-type dipeptide/oligopeptide/nickel transport system ATPase component